MTAERQWQTCARHACSAQFLVGPDGDRDIRGHPVYCSEDCRRRETGAVQRAAWTELARRHRDEYRAIRREITAARRA